VWATLAIGRDEFDQPILFGVSNTEFSESDTGEGVPIKIFCQREIFSETVGCRQESSFAKSARGCLQGWPIDIPKNIYEFGNTRA
jgi:hypothetical protein